SHIAVASNPQSNIIPNPSGADGTKGWLTYNATTRTGNIGYGYYFYVDPAAGQNAIFETDYLPVWPNFIYSMQAQAFGNASFKFYVTWHDANKNSISSTSTVTVPAGSWTRLTIENEKAPSNAAFVLFRFYSDGTDDSRLYVRQAKMENSPVCTSFSDDATIAQQTASIDTLNEAVITPDGAYAKAITRLDVNGYISGVTQTNDGTESDFIIAADKFGVLS